MALARAPLPAELASEARELFQGEGLGAPDGIDSDPLERAFRALAAEGRRERVPKGLPALRESGSHDPPEVAPSRTAARGAGSTSRRMTVDSTSGRGRNALGGTSAAPHPRVQRRQHGERRTRFPGLAQERSATSRWSITTIQSTRSGASSKRSRIAVPVEYGGSPRRRAASDRGCPRRARESPRPRPRASGRRGGRAGSARSRSISTATRDGRSPGGPRERASPGPISGPARRARERRGDGLRHDVRIDEEVLPERAVGPRPRHARARRAPREAPRMRSASHGSRSPRRRRRQPAKAITAALSVHRESGGTRTSAPSSAPIRSIASRARGSRRHSAGDDDVARAGPRDRAARDVDEAVDHGALEGRGDVLGAPRAGRALIELPEERS